MKSPLCRHRGDGVLVDERVARHQNHRLLERLRDEHAVERVLVKRWQNGGTPGVSPADGQLG